MRTCSVLVHRLLFSFGCFIYVFFLFSFQQPVSQYSILFSWHYNTELDQGALFCWKWNNFFYILEAREMASSEQLFDLRRLWESYVRAPQENRTASWTLHNAWSHGMTTTTIKYIGVDIVVMNRCRTHLWRHHWRQKGDVVVAADASYERTFTHLQWTTTMPTSLFYVYVP